MKITSSISDFSLEQADLLRLTPSADYTATAVWADVPSWSLTIPNPGQFTISASTSGSVSDTNADSDAQLYVRLALGGRAIEGTMRRLSHDTTSGTFVFPLDITYTGVFAGGQAVTLQAYTPNAGDTCIVCGNGGSIGAVPSFGYVCLSNYITAPSIPITSWETFTMTLGSSGFTAPTKGTIVHDLAAWRRVGKSMEIIYSFWQSAGGTTGSTATLWNLPGTYVIDTAYMVPTASIGDALGVCGVASAYNVGSGRGHGVMKVYSNSLSMGIKNNTTELTVGSAGYGMGAAVQYSFSVNVPVLGW